MSISLIFRFGSMVPVNVVLIQCCKRGVWGFMFEYSYVVVISVFDVAETPSFVSLCFPTRSPRLLTSWTFIGTINCLSSHSGRRLSSTWPSRKRLIHSYSPKVIPSYPDVFRSRTLKIFGRSVRGKVLSWGGDSVKTLTLKKIFPSVPVSFLRSIFTLSSLSPLELFALIV